MEIRCHFPLGCGNSSQTKIPKVIFINRDFPTITHQKNSVKISGKKRPFSETEENRASSSKWWRQISATKTKPSQQTLKKKPINGGEREMVQAKLRLFRAKCRELSQVPNKETKTKRVDFNAMNDLKREGKLIAPTTKIMGSISSVEVGDRFEYRVELTIAGLHSQNRHGIDFMAIRGRLLATCIVATEGYSDNMSCSNELTYTGEGGGIFGVTKDQKLARGNLALKNSMVAKNDVRVVRGIKLSRLGKTIYVYDGLYHVTSFVEKRGLEKNKVFEFKLTRQPGQPHIAWHRFKCA